MKVCSMPGAVLPDPLSRLWRDVTRLCIRASVFPGVSPRGGESARRRPNTRFMDESSDFFFFLGVLRTYDVTIAVGALARIPETWMRIGTRTGQALVTVRGCTPRPAPKMQAQSEKSLTPTHGVHGRCGYSRVASRLSLCLILSDRKSVV